VVLFERSNFSNNVPVVLKKIFFFQCETGTLYNKTKEKLERCVPKNWNARKEKAGTLHYSRRELKC